MRRQLSAVILGVATLSVATLVLSGCQPSAPPTPPSSAPVERKAALLDSAIDALPEWFSDSDLNANGLSATRSNDLRVRLESPRNEVVYREELRADRPVFDQISPEPPSWERDNAFVDVIDSSGTVIGDMGLEWTGAGWEAQSASYGPRSDEPDRKLQEATTALELALGGSLDETAVAGTWLLARKGTREAGVVPWVPPLMYSSDVPDEGRIYQGADLVRWLNEFRAGQRN